MKIKPRRRFTEEFRRFAVQESIKSPETVRQVADRLDISPKLLEAWRGKMSKSKKPVIDNNGPEKSLKDLQRENRVLKRRLERAELENEILKKAKEYFDKLPK